MLRAFILLKLMFNSLKQLMHIGYNSVITLQSFRF